MNFEFQARQVPEIQSKEVQNERHPQATSEVEAPHLPGGNVVLGKAAVVAVAVVEADTPLSGITTMIQTSPKRPKMRPCPRSGLWTTTLWQLWLSSRQSHPSTTFILISVSFQACFEDALAASLGVGSDFPGETNTREISN
jgi:hypothetical protein